MSKHLDQWYTLVVVFCEEFGHQVLILLAQALFKWNLGQPLLDGLLHHVLIIAPEWSIPMDQLKQQDSKRPDINLVVMSLLIEHLWCHVLKGSTECFTLLHVA